MIWIIEVKDWDIECALELSNHRLRVRRFIRESDSYLVVNAESDYASLCHYRSSMIPSHGYTRFERDLAVVGHV
jgi:hypothetical protein